MSSNILLEAYHKLPYMLRATATSAVAYRKARKKYGDYFQHCFKYLMSSTACEQQAQAENEIEEYLAYLRKNSRFYSSYLDGGSRIEDLPIIDKGIVLRHYKDIALEKPFFVGKSSGTSGQPLEVPYSARVYQKEYAFWWYHRSICDIKRGDRVATFAGHKIADVRRDGPPYWVYNAAENQMFFSSYHISRNNLPAYIEKLNRFKPVFIHGYPSSLYLLASFILEHGVALDFRPRMIVGSSETTLDFQRSAIEKAFSCRVFIWYGNTEFCGHITQCTNGRLHVQPYHSYVRILKDDNAEAKPGESGRIVATNFSNYAFPLINYDMKDVVKVSDNQDCECERGGLILDYILGRMEDYVVTPAGRLVGRLDHLFKDAQYVRNAQIVQSEANRIIIRIERESGYSVKVEKAIADEARRRLGDAIEIEFDYAHEIEKEANGKFKFIVQNMTVGKAGNVIFR